MNSLTLLAIEIYQKLGKKYPNLTERREATKQYILNKITHWGVKTLEQGDNYFFKPVGFEGTEDSSYFEIRLIYDESTDFHELKFGNLSVKDEEKQFKWNDKDPYRLQKALFLTKVLENEILPLLINNKIQGIQFSPYDKDDLGSDRLSYFRNMFDKLGKDKLTWNHNKEHDFYYITKKIN
jgi:hypothetical protein